MSGFGGLLTWELRRLARAGTARVALGLLFAAGLLALFAAGREVARHERELAAADPAYAAQMERIGKQFPAGGHAGYVAYYTFFPVRNPTPPLAVFSLGLRDVTPSVVWIRLLGLEGQLHESGIGNPVLQALGAFDLAFVLCALAPLVLLVLLHDVLSRDRAQGVLPLVVAQAGGLGRVFAARVLARFAAVAAVAVALFAVGAAWHGVPVNGAALAWLGDALLQLACWTAIGALLAALATGVAATLAAAVSAWVVGVVLAPALINLATVTLHPVPEGLAITVAQRQETHAGWDRPKEDTFARFFALRPEWRDTPPVTGRFAWKWYYAMHQVGDASVAANAERYRARLVARAALLARLAWAVPPATAQLLLSRRAGTDLEAHLAFLDRVRAFHGEMQVHFFPAIFAERELPPTAWREFPRFVPPPSAPAAGGPGERLPLVVTVLLCAVFLPAALRRAARLAT